MHDNGLAAADAAVGIARSVLMVRPAAFGVNEQTAASNAFQHCSVSPAPDLQTKILSEFDEAHARLEQAGVTVICVQDTVEPPKPDAVFPNNWVTFHADGTAILYPLAAANRRPERRLDILDILRDQHGFDLQHLVDLSSLERRSLFVEGTGSLVLDRRTGIAYAALSARTQPAALRVFASRSGYRLQSFHTADATGLPIYHTNVMLSLGSAFAVLCGEVVRDPVERAGLREQLEASGREIVDISIGQMAAFAGNLLELETDGGPLLAISATAVAALERRQLRALEQYARLLPIPLPQIESGGGSIRCMLAEILLPRA